MLLRLYNVTVCSGGSSETQIRVWASKVLSFGLRFQGLGFKVELRSAVATTRVFACRAPDSK